MSKVQTYTSTGSKLIYHPDVVRKVKKSALGTPVSLQIAPTSRCNLNCVFCSNVNRDKHEDLDFQMITNILSALRTLGLKTVEWTGGGDPTQYEYINECIEFAHSLGLQQGFITNGVALQAKVMRSNLNKLHWVRVSMNCLDYVDKINLPEYFAGTLGFSYVMNEKTDREIFDRIREYINEYQPSYVRVVPNCQATHEEQERNNKLHSVFVEELGDPYFYQFKNFEKPDKCWWGYFKPFILHDGWVYPCSSVVLNEDAERHFNSKYRWVRAEQLPFLYNYPMQFFDTCNCTHCVFTSQNNQIQDLLCPNIMENFI